MKRKPLLLISVILLLSTETFCQQKLRRKDDYGRLGEVMLYLQASHNYKSDYYITEKLYVLFTELNNSLQLGFTLEYRDGVSLAITVPGKKKVTLPEWQEVRIRQLYYVNLIPNYISKMEKFCEAAKEPILNKLQTANYTPDYYEYLSDFLISLDDPNSWIMPKNNKLAYYSSDNNHGLNTSRDLSGKYRVIHVNPNSSAEIMGIKEGDKIVEIRDIPASWLGHGEFRRLMIPKEQSVPLQVERQGSLFNATLRGYSKRVPSDSLFFTTDSILYVRANDIKRGFVAKFKSLLDEYSTKKIIVDLRKCSGGVLDECINLADMFVNKGDTIARSTYKGFIVDNPTTFTGTYSTPYKVNNLIVLTSGQTGSGAEVIVSALKNYNKAKVIGAKTTGIGTITKAFDSSNYFFGMEAVGELYTVEGVPLSGNGIEPTISISDSEDALQIAKELLAKQN
jgi:carboxyl-terminal processing protease